MEKTNLINKNLNYKCGKVTGDCDNNSQSSIKNSSYCENQDIYGNALATEHHIKQFLTKEQYNKRVYDAHSECIDFLEQLVKVLNNDSDIEKLKLEIESLRLEQEKYYEPSILEGARLDLLHEKDRKQSLEKSSYQLIKK